MIYCMTHHNILSVVYQVVWNYYRGDWFGELALLNDGTCFD